MEVNYELMKNRDFFFFFSFFLLNIVDWCSDTQVCMRARRNQHQPFSISNQKGK